MSKKNITVYRLGKDTNISASLIYGWQKGNTFPSSSNIAKLSKYFDVSTDYFYDSYEETKGTRKCVIMGYHGGFKQEIEISEEEFQIAVDAIYNLRKTQSTDAQRMDNLMNEK